MQETSPWPAGSLAEALAQIPDRRRKQRRVHDLVPLLQFAVVAMMAGMRSLYAIAQWGRDRLQDDPQLLVELGLAPGRSPSVATLHRVFKNLDVAAFEAAVGQWLARTGLQPGEPLAVDGKSLRGIHGEKVPGVHLVAVFSLSSRAVLAQVAAKDKEGELSAAKTALCQVPLRGHPVLTDALHTQREVCEQIVAAGGDYLVPVKKNQPTLLSDVQEVFSPSGAAREDDGRAAGAGGAPVAAAGMATAGQRVEHGGGEG